MELNNTYRFSFVVVFGFSVLTWVAGDGLLGGGGGLGLFWFDMILSLLSIMDLTKRCYSAWIMEKIKQIWTDSTFNAITANGMREMDEPRFYQACQDIIEI